MTSLIFCDTETTGLSSSAEIIELTLLAEDGSILFNSLLKPKRYIPSDATAIHGITNAMVQSAPSYESKKAEIHKIVTGKTLVLHNAAYDMRYLQDLKNLVTVVCTLKLARKIIPQAKNHKLETLATLSGFKSENAYHRALEDTKATRHIYYWLLSQQKENSPPKKTISQNISNEKPVEKKKEISSFVSPWCCSKNDPRLQKTDYTLPEQNDKGKGWTETQDVLLACLWKDGKTLEEISQSLPRTPIALFMRLEKIKAIPEGTNPYAL